MKNLFHTLTLLVGLGALSTLAGCELYFGGGGGGGGGSWTYCGSDGFYQCKGDNCEWTSPTCPAGGGSSDPGSGSGNGSGYGCTSNTDCAAGCFCQNGTCEEGGFCATDADCGSGFHCDTQRSSCEPNPPGCTKDSDCNVGGGQFCDVPTGTCTQGSCAGTITCNTAAPTCPTGQTPLIYNGCYTGACFDTASCSEAPTCKNINDEPNCLNDSACSAVYTGLNCTRPDGTACTSGDTGCTCLSFVFDHCADKTASMGRMVIQNSQGQWIDASPLLLNQ